MVIEVVPESAGQDKVMLAGALCTVADTFTALITDADCALTSAPMVEMLAAAIAQARATEVRSPMGSWSWLEGTLHPCGLPEARQCAGKGFKLAGDGPMHGGAAFLPSMRPARLQDRPHAMLAGSDQTGIAPDGGNARQC